MKTAVFLKPVAAPVQTESEVIADRGKAELTPNPADLNALEAALKLKDTVGGSVTVVSMAPKMAEGMLRRVCAMGADRLVMLSDTAFAGSDTYMTAFTLKSAVEKLGGFDLILCGRRTTDGETGQVGPETAALLNIPCATNCVEIKVLDGALLCRRMLEEECWTVRLKLPALISVYNSVNSPRLPSLLGIRKASEMPVLKFDAGALGFEPEKCGLAGSFTRVCCATMRPFEKRRPTQTTADKDGIDLMLKMIRHVRMRAGDKT
ncbi:MAG: electron transfer flavoprotein subunit beta [Negativicutes bacterium]